MTLRNNQHLREHKTKQAPLKNRIKAYIASNPLATRSEIRKEFCITKKDLAILLAKIGKNNLK